MRKLFFIPVFLLAAGTATASVLTGGLSELNQEIQKILQPFQNEKTAAQLAFQVIETNSERALSAALTASYSKTGSMNTVEIHLPHLSYSYGDGSSPATNVQGSLKVDLTKILPQEQINEMIPTIDTVLLDMAKGFTEKYGEAVTVTVTVLERRQDTSGNYTGFKALIDFVFDFSKLPETLPPSEIIVHRGSLSLDMDVIQGAQITATTYSNTLYKGFQPDQPGLKETLEDLLAQKPEALEKFKTLFTMLEEIALQFVGD